MKIVAVVRGRAPRLAGAAWYDPVDARESDQSVAMLHAEAMPASWPDGTQAWLVDERRQWSSDTPPAVTRLSFLHRASSMSRDDFGVYWRDVHAPLARRHHPNVVRYVQNVVVQRLTPETPEVDGIAELSFVDVADMEERRYDSDEGRRVISDDVRRFINLSAGWSLLVSPRPDDNAF
jgi:uncharacterized protein (TIGR02118 family)